MGTLMMPTVGVLRRSCVVAVLLCVAFALPAVPVSAQSSVFPLDVWADRGGEGPDVSGGTYQVGEIITVWLHVGLDCQVTWIVTGPAGSSSEGGSLSAGTYSLELGVAEESDVGRWTLEVVALAGSVLAMDTMDFDVVSGKPATPSTPTSPTAAPPTTSLPSTSIDEHSAVVLDALVALKMAQGSMEPDQRYDVDGNGQVTLEDARLLLRWAIQ